jgi:hypothetical protein
VGRLVGLGLLIFTLAFGAVALTSNWTVGSVEVVTVHKARGSFGLATVCQGRVSYEADGHLFTATVTEKLLGGNRPATSCGFQPGGRAVVSYSDDRPEIGLAFASLSRALVVIGLIVVLVVGVAARVILSSSVDDAE